MNDSFKGLITMLCPWALLTPAFLVQLRTVPTVVTAQIFCACQGSRVRRERNAQHAGHADWFCPAVSLGGSSYFLWKRCVVFQQMKLQAYLPLASFAFYRLIGYEHFPEYFFNFVRFYVIIQQKIDLKRSSTYRWPFYWESEAFICWKNKKKKLSQDCLDCWDRSFSK